jgi:hypothetical protein
MICERAKDNLDDYLRGRVAEPMRVVLEHHFAECDVCRQELLSAQELAHLFQGLPVIEPPAQFRARLLAQLPEISSRRVWMGRWSLGNPANASPVLKAGFAVLVAGLLFTQTPFYGHLMGPVSIDFHSDAPSAVPYTHSQQPEWLFTGSGSVASTPTDRTLNIILQPSTELRHARITLEELSDGLQCLSAGISTERGKVLWQGSLSANQSVAIPLRFHALKPGVQQALFHMESDGKVYREKLFIPTGILDPAVATETLEGTMSTTDTLQQLAGRFGVVFATDLTHERMMKTRLTLASPGRSVQELAAQRNMQWKVSRGVYNLFGSNHSR